MRYENVCLRNSRPCKIKKPFVKSIYMNGTNGIVTATSMSKIAMDPKLEYLLDNADLVLLSPGDYRSTYRPTLIRNFIRDHLLTHPNYPWIIGNMQNVYLFIGYREEPQAQFETLVGELGEDLKKFGSSIFGWILTKHEKDGSIGIELMASRLLGVHIGTRMLKKLSAQLKKPVHPNDVLDSARGFWDKMCARGITTPQ